MALILVVDDDARNREILVEYLARAGHRTFRAGSADEGLRLADEHHPDLALLDVSLPGMDGMALTRRLKEMYAGEYLPVILLAAGDELDVRLAGYQAGADEVLVKPVYRAELLMRVGNLLALREERLQMARSHEELLQLQRFKENLTLLLVHDLKNPLSALAANLEFTRHELRFEARPEVSEAVEDGMAACSRLRRMVDNLVDVGRFEEGRLPITMAPLALRPMLVEVARVHRRAAEERQATLAVDCVEMDVVADRELLMRVVENVLENALRRTPRRGMVTLSAHMGDDCAWVKVAGSGPAIPASLRRTLFDKYGAIEQEPPQPRIGTGLGLYFCRLAVEAHGGRIFVDENEKSLAFVVELPQPRKQPLLIPQPTNGQHKQQQQ